MAVVKKYQAEVISIVNTAGVIYTVELKSHSGPFRYMPGQFLHLALDEYDPSSGWPESRCFSIQGQNSPDQIILSFSAKGRFTTRMSNELKVGKLVVVKLPYGSLFHDIPANRKCIFIAGGTGITPFLSLFTDQSFQSYKSPKLYAGFRDSQYNLYDQYLSRAKDINKEFEYHILYEDVDGILDIGEILKQDQPESLFFS
jgi:predicted ferric reductase